jgi:hypothetical protein
MAYGKVHFSVFSDRLQHVPDVIGHWEFEVA